MSTPWGVDRPGDVVDKVLRRAEVARMARLLQTRLALASFKTRHGWENLDLDTIEPKFEMKLRRKRPGSSGETVSDSSSSVSDTQYPTGPLNSSSPITAPIFSDQVHRSSCSVGGHRKRPHPQSSFQHPGSTPGSRKRPRSATNAAPPARPPQASWKDLHRLPRSSPGYGHDFFDFPASHGPSLSFVSETSTLPDDPASLKLTLASDDDDQELPTQPFQPSASQLHSSPPRTPPPTRARSARLRRPETADDAEAAAGTGEEGADLLLYLATSPSPANPAMKARIFPPSTPPSRNPALPSSMMTTPSGGAFLAGYGGPNTPSQGFNFADFVNITPSPAQGAWANRTPATAKTPLAAREARRRLNFDALVPPTGSAGLSNLGGVGAKQTGLGMELGGELVS
ncbi:MAG: hypothetical protein M1832_003169 [Thelocarpon impressellum]|nr:MAG: hypothetical protein M1832_003169 [Thelocarpon impressellum]